MTGKPVTRPRPGTNNSFRAIAMRTLSIVVPVKDERDNVEPLYRLVKDALRDGIAWEVVFVDDGSTDGTFDELVRLANLDARVKVVRLRRNFGQASAMQAGIDASSGELVVTMDGDLQNDPADIPLLIAKLDEGYDMVLGERASARDSFIRTFPSRVANCHHPEGHGHTVSRFRLHLAGDARRRGTKLTHLRGNAPVHSGAGE